MKGTIFAVLLILGFSQAQVLNTTRCFQQVCRECPKVPDTAATEVRCEFRSLVGATWLEGESNSDPPKAYSSPDPEFVCLKMVASNPKITGDSTDHVKGCVLKQEAAAVCDGLVAVEKLRGKTDAICVTCSGINCNGASSNVATLLTIFAVMIGAAKALL